METQELIKFEEVSSTLMTAEPVLKKNRALFTQASTAAQALLDTIEASGMSDDLDKEINEWQVKAKKALEINYNRRSPITQLLTKIASEFTSLENPLNPQKADSIFSKLQRHRNDHAKVKEDQRKAKEAEILRNQNIEKERISLTTEAERQIRESYNTKLFAFKNHIQKLLNEATLETLAEVKKKIEEVKLDYPRDAFNKLECAIFPQYLDTVEVDRIMSTTRIKLYEELSANFRENMEVDKQAALDQIPSKKKELERIARADASEAERLKQEAEKRKLAQEAILKKEQAEKAAKEAAKLEADKSLNEAQTLFDTASQMAEVQNSSSKVKKSYIVEVKDVAGWGAIFMFYFEKVGMKMDVEAFGKKSLNQMKKEIEKIANTTSEMIDHVSIEYTEDVKAVVTK